MAEPQEDDSELLAYLRTIAVKAGDERLLRLKRTSGIGIAKPGLVTRTRAGGYHADTSRFCRCRVVCHLRAPRIPSWGRFRAERPTGYQLGWSYAQDLIAD